jgi:hypothetical protein
VQEVTNPTIEQCVDLARQHGIFVSKWDVSGVTKHNLYGLVLTMLDQFGAKAEAQAVPDGFVLVPKEPTPEMLQAGTYAGTLQMNASPRVTYRAMLAAAPVAESLTAAQGSAEPVAYIIRHVSRPHGTGMVIPASQVGSYQRATLTRQPLYTAPQPDRVAEFLPMTDEDVVSFHSALPGCAIVREQEYERLRKDADGLADALRRAQCFIRNGVALGYIRMPDADCPDTAHETLPAIDVALAEHDARGGK